MRDFMIKSLDTFIWILVVVVAIGAVIGGISTMFAPQGGFFVGLFVIVVGLLYALLFGGFMFMAIGVYHNTRRTADAVERLAARG